MACKLVNCCSTLFGITILQFLFLYSSSKEGCEDLPSPYSWPSSPHRAMPDSEVQHEGKGWERLYPWGAEGDVFLLHCSYGYPFFIYFLRFPMLISGRGCVRKPIYLCAVCMNSSSFISCYHSCLCYIVPKFVCCIGSFELLFTFSGAFMFCM